MRNASRSLHLRAFAATRWATAACIVAAAALLFMTSGAAWADPPGRVVRLGYAAGAVSFLPAGDDEWVQARVNRPLWNGDRLWVADNARAELQIGGAALRVGDETSVAVLNFDDRLAQFELTQGVAQLDVRSLDRDDVIEIDTPNLALTIRRPGSYRIDVGADGEATTIAVLRGEADAFGTRASYTLRSGDRIRFHGTDLADYAMEPARPADAFDGWVAQRVRLEYDSASARYVAPDMIGYADLDAYGDWRTDSRYGSVWVPTRIAPDWAPYRYGHWAWIDPWGWTWVDDAPWGFAPFHYGRWAYVDSRYWAWIPGPRTVRPVYAPALVAFIGGSGFGVSLSIGTGFGVGWFPLAPGEVYWPTYGVSRDYFTRVNVTNTVVNVTNVTNIYNNPTRATEIRYVNRQVANAVTAVPTEAFVQAQSVHRAAVRVDNRDLQKASVLTAVSVAPEKASISGAAPAAQSRPSARALERAVVAKEAPPPAPPPLVQRQAALKRQPGKPLDRAALERLAPSPAAAQPSVKVVQPSTPKPIPSTVARTQERQDAATPSATRSGERRGQADERDVPGRDDKRVPRANGNGVEKEARGAPPGSKGAGADAAAQPQPPQRAGRSPEPRAERAPPPTADRSPAASADRSPPATADRAPAASVAPREATREQPRESMREPSRAIEPRVSRVAPPGPASPERPRAAPPAEREQAQEANAPRESARRPQAEREPAKRPQTESANVGPRAPVAAPEAPRRGAVPENKESPRRPPRDAQPPPESARPATPPAPPQASAVRPAPKATPERPATGKAEPRDRESASGKAENRDRNGKEQAKGRKDEDKDAKG